MSASVFKKILAVRKEVGPVKKDGKNKYQGYDYQTADAVFTAVRSAMNNHDLLLFPSMESVTAEDGCWIVMYKMTWADVDSGETWFERWAMTLPMEAKSTKGNYLDDKAMGKAGTYALRYYMMRTLQITTKDDIDNDIDAGDPANLPSRRSKSSPFPPRQEVAGGSPANKSMGTAEAKADRVETVEDVDWSKFWPWVKGLGLTKAEVHEALGVELSAKEFIGSKQQMMDIVQNAANAKQDAA
jgi:hypothetical protein